MIEKKIANERGAFLGKDGLHYCSKCGGVVEKKFDIGSMGEFTATIPCPCRQEEMKREERERKKREHNDTVDRNSGICFYEKTMRDWTFANDDGTVPAMQKAKEYVINWDTMRKNHIGLLLWGDVGTGKTYMAAAIANALLEEEKMVLMTDFARISNISAFDAEDYIESLSRYDLLIIDDLGAERSTEFAMQNVFNVINRRWVSGKPMIITTNLNLNMLLHPVDTDVTRLRIYDRILEMCKPIQMVGESKRHIAGRNKMHLMKKIFEGEET